MKYLISLLALVSFSAFATDYQAKTTTESAVESESTESTIKNKKMVEGDEVETESTEEGTAPEMDY